jgi:hypothetical protein
MTVRKKLRAWALSLLILSLLIPATLAAGSHADAPVAGDDESVILFTLGNRDEVTWGGATARQTITTRNNDCRVVEFGGPEILVFAAFEAGEPRPLGHVKDGFGVLGVNDGLGEPCGRVLAGQSIAVSLGSAVSGHLMTAVDIDLELKFGALVEISYLHGGVLVASDQFSSSDSRADDGPDSKDGDNYRYPFRPTTGSGDQLYFDTVVFTAAAGSFSLEGGADLASNNDPGAFGSLDPSSKSSQFAVVPVFDGEITCQDELLIDDGNNVFGTLKMHSMEIDEEWIAEGCPLKPYFAFATDDTIGFIPVLEGTRARYTIEVTALEQAITMLGGQITSLEVLYDPEGGTPTTPLQALRRSARNRPHRSWLPSVLDAGRHRTSSGR